LLQLAGGINELQEIAKANGSSLEELKEKLEQSGASTVLLTEQMERMAADVAAIKDSVASIDAKAGSIDRVRGGRSCAHVAPALCLCVAGRGEGGGARSMGMVARCAADGGRPVHCPLLPCRVAGHPPISPLPPDRPPLATGHPHPPPAPPPPCAEH
jgi:hypothetical protein